MANLSESSSGLLNLSGQSLDELRSALCETTRISASIQQQHDHAATIVNYFSAMNSHTTPIEDTIPSEHSVSRLVVRYLLRPTSELEAGLDYYFIGFWRESGDERANSLPFMSGGPWKLLLATMIYLYLVKSLLPRAMKTTPALDLNWPLRFYNLLMIVSNIYAFRHGCRLLDFGRKCFGCEIINHRDYSHAGMELLNYGWLFLLSRLVEWLDTMFFVLRKKENQVTKLHVFHHSFVPFLCWTYLKYHPGRTVAFFPLVNSFVHSIMYTYYFLATFGPAIQPYLWWKKYLTSLQIAQFVLILIQLATIPLSSNERCQYPRGFLYVAFAGAILFLWLFYTYYIETYNKKSALHNKPNYRQQQQHSKTRDHCTTTTTARQKHADREGNSRALSETIENALLVESSKLD